MHVIVQKMEQELAAQLLHNQGSICSISITKPRSFLKNSMRDFLALPMVPSLALHASSHALPCLLVFGKHKTREIFPLS